MKIFAVAVLGSLLASIGVAGPERSTSAWAAEAPAGQAVESAVSPVQDSLASKPGIEGVRPEAVGVVIQYENVQDVDVPESVAQVLEHVEQGIDEAGSQLSEIPEVDLAVEINDGLFSVGFEDLASEDTVGDIVDAIAESPGVASVEPDWQISINFEDVVIDEPIDMSEIDGDSVSTEAVQSNVIWGLDRIDQQTLPLNFTYHYDDTGQGVRVYVVDTGVRSSHIDFQGRVTSGFSVISDGQGTNDCNGHGTHVAGTVAGALHGVAKQATIVPVRVLDCAGSGTLSQLLTALDWVKANALFSRPVKSVVNLSLGGPFSDMLNAKVTELVSAGIPVVVASGNEAKDACEVSPASAPAAIAVNASTTEDRDASFSNYGECTDLYAPGVAIKSAYHLSDASTARASGTSMAAPHVAGAIARLLARGANGTDDFVDLFATANPDAINAGLPGDPTALLYIAPGSGVPSAPQNARASLENGAIRVAWDWPDSSGDSSDLSFVAQVFDSAEALVPLDECVSQASFCTFQELELGETYYFSVFARSGAGDGQHSAPRVTLDYDLPPIDIGYAWMQDRAMALTWCPRDPADPTPWLEGGRWPEAGLQGLTNPAQLNAEFAAHNRLSWRVESLSGQNLGSGELNWVRWDRPYSYYMPKCGNTQGEDLLRIDDLPTPGTTYRVVVDYSLGFKSGTRTGVFEKLITTSGGCPIGAPMESPQPNGGGFLDENNRVVNAFYGWGQFSWETGGYDWLYDTGVWDNPDLYGVKVVPSWDWPGFPKAGIGMYYDPETGGFGWPLANGQLSTTQSLIEQVGLEGCRGVADINLDVAADSADKCTKTSRGVVGVRDGGCVVEVTARSKSTRFGARSTLTREAFAVVKTAPIGPPSTVSATPIGQSSVALTWRAPTTRGAAPVEDYLVEYSSDNGLNWAEVEPDPISASTSETVRDLIPGERYLFRVSAKNSVSQSNPVRSAAVTVQGSFMTEAPTITGSAVVGQTLSASLGEWTPEPTTVAYQWLLNGQPISRATGSTYVVGSRDVGRQVSVRVTGSRASYVSTVRESTRTSAVVGISPLLVTNAASVRSTGSVGVFQEVTYSGGSGAGAVSLTVAGSGCTVAGTMVTARAASTCTVTLVKAASGIFPSQASQPTVFSFRSTTTSTFWSNYWWDEYDWTVADITQTERDLVSINAEINRLAANGMLRSSWGERAIARRLALWAHLEEREEELEYISWRLWLHGYSM